jgi:hypothetical protein
MLKMLSIVPVVALLFLARPQSDKFSRYKSIETYEVRPGILMMPRYTEGGEVCEMTLEKHHYSNGTAYLGSTIPRETIIELTNELVPQSERGRQTMGFGKEYMSAYGGNGVATFAEYENISIEISGIASPVASAGDIVVVIKWKKRKCAASAH